MPVDGVPRKADPREVGWQFDDPEFEVHFWIGPTPDGKWLESFLVAFDTDEPFEDEERSNTQWFMYPG